LSPERYKLKKTLAFKAHILCLGDYSQLKILNNSVNLIDKIKAEYYKSATEQQLPLKALIACSNQINKLIPEQQKPSPIDHWWHLKTP
jgi:siderophore synthetase component